MLAAREPLVALSFLGTGKSHRYHGSVGFNTDKPGAALELQHGLTNLLVSLRGNNDVPPGINHSPKVLQASSNGCVAGYRERVCYYGSRCTLG